MENFELFNTPHLVVITITIIFSIIFTYAGRRSNTVRKVISFILIGSLCFSVIAAAVYNYLHGYLSLSTILPMHLSDWIIIFVFVTFITKSIYAFEVLYFWGMGGTLQALITPDLTLNFPSFGFFLFFINHSVIIICIIYFIFAYQLRPYPPSIKRVFIWSQVYFICAFPINLILGTNYGFLMHKPEQGSLLDYLGPWPYYLISLEIIALISFFIYYSPFYMYDKIYKRRLNRT